MFENNDMPVLKIFRAICQGVFRHARPLKKSLRRQKSQYSFDGEAFSACAYTFDSDADRPLKKPACMREVENFCIPGFADEATSLHSLAEAFEDISLMD